METEAEKLVNDFVEATNTGDMDTAVSFLTDDCIYIDKFVGETNYGKEAIAGFFNLWHSRIPDHKWEVISIFSGRERVALESVWSGTSPATGKHLANELATIFELSGGKISKVTDYYHISTE